jgi:hypothetical protein
MTRYLSLVATLGLLLGACTSAGGEEAEHPPSTQLAWHAAADGPPHALRQPTTTTSTSPPPPPTTLPPPTTTTTAPPPPTTAPPPPPAQVQPASSGSCGGHAELVARHFPAEQLRTACRVLLCESGGNFQAENPSSSASGGWQFLSSTWERTTGTPAPASAYSPDTQTAAAAQLWASSGWGQWSCA